MNIIKLFICSVFCDQKTVIDYWSVGYWCFCEQCELKGSHFNIVNMNIYGCVDHYISIYSG